MPSAFTSLGCTYPLPNTGSGGRPDRPASSTSTPWRCPAQRRAHPSATKFAIVAPVVSTPPHAGGSPNSSFSHPTATCSSRPASGVATHAPEFWSSVEVSQSAPRAAGVVPPFTKWKNLGPAECTAAPNPATSSSSAATAPTPSSGSDPPNAAAASSARGSRTGRSAIPLRYAAASRAARSSTSGSSSGWGSGMARMLLRQAGLSAGGRRPAPSRARPRASRSTGASRARAGPCRDRSPPSRGRA